MSWGVKVPTHRQRTCLLTPTQDASCWVVTHLIYLPAAVDTIRRLSLATFWGNILCNLSLTECVDLFGSTFCCVCPCEGSALLFDGQWQWQGAGAGDRGWGRGQWLPAWQTLISKPQLANFVACCQNAVVTRCSCGAVSGHVYLLHILSCLKVPANRTRQLQFNRRLARPEGGGRQHGSGAWPEQIVCLRYIFYGNKYASTFAAVIVARRTA